MVRGRSQLAPRNCAKICVSRFVSEGRGDAFFLFTELIGQVRFWGKILGSKVQLAAGCSHLAARLSKHSKVPFSFLKLLVSYVWHPFYLPAFRCRHPQGSGAA